MTVPRASLLVIGANGFIGRYLALAAVNHFRVFCGRNAARAPSPIAGAEEVAIDITDRESVRSAFSSARPEIVALLAALSDIDRCECEPELASAINVKGAENVALACEQIGSRLIFTSSAAVFDGTRHGYTEADPPNPVSVYGRSKAGAEALIAGILPNSFIIRLSLVLGVAARDGTNALLNKLLVRFQSGHAVVAPDYEFRNPIDVDTLVELLLELAPREDVRGLFHFGSMDSLSRFELTQRLARRMGFSTDLVLRQSEPIAGRAPRGRDHFLLSAKIHNLCGTHAPNCEQVIERCVHAIA